MYDKSAATAPTKPPRLLFVQWLEHFQVWQSSDQTVEEYCQLNHLSVKAFKKQYNRSRREAAQTNGTTLSALTAKQFAPVTLVGASSTSAIEFIFRSGVVMKIPASSSLPAVLKSLEAYL